ncbi:hypothetical protein BV25DRAFT_1916371 [Artomyces pyxidatus]|uniref:Uncharacterized protein n=1 Tax=Artomyces pyxidatus TaxID=48021 RepID=A0ACB8SZU2_9AGAM|nr:hypothetical protein BV25DRAFT_1916371 [Artomyces pyxidatus]
MLLSDIDVPADVILAVCTLSTLETLSYARCVNKELRLIVMSYLQSRWNVTLTSYVSSPDAFRDMLRMTRSVVSGSTVLQFVLQGTQHEHNWAANDLDIYCPLTTAVILFDYLLSVEKFRVKQRIISRDRSQGVSSEYNNGAISCVTTLITPTGRKVDIITATRNSPLLPITYFWGTLVINYISADDICITYPRLTLSGTGLLNPVRIPAPKVLVCIEKYTNRGFLLSDFVHAPGRLNRASLSTCRCGNSEAYYALAAASRLTLVAGYIYRLPSSDHVYYLPHRTGTRIITDQLSINAIILSALQFP